MTRFLPFLLIFCGKGFNAHKLEQYNLVLSRMAILDSKCTAQFQIGRHPWGKNKAVDCSKDYIYNNLR
jgi:hypothetical protein